MGGRRLKNVALLPEFGTGVEKALPVPPGRVNYLDADAAGNGWWCCFWHFLCCVSLGFLSGLTGSGDGRLGKEHRIMSGIKTGVRLIYR